MSNTEVMPFDIHGLKNAKFVDFFEDVNSLIITKEPVTTALKPLTDKLDGLVTKMKSSFVAIHGNSKTELIYAADEERDKVHRGLVHLLNAYRFSNDPVKEQAAGNLFFAVKQFGLGTLRRADNDSETSLLDALVETVNSDKYATDIVTLPEVGIFMTALGAAIDKYKQVKGERVSEQAEKLDYTTREVRAEIVPVYRRIVGAVEAMALVGIEPAYSELVTELNAIISMK